MHSAQLMSKHTAQLCVMQGAYAMDVTISSVRHQRRQANLAIVIKEAGGASALAALIGTPKSHISAMLSGARGMGDALAAKIERKTEREAGWMDEEHEQPDIVFSDGSTTTVIQAKTLAGALTPRETELLAAFRDLPVGERDELYNHVMDRAKTFRDYAQQVMQRFGVTGTASNTRVTESIESGTGLLEPQADFGVTEPGSLGHDGKASAPASNYKLPKPITAPIDHRATKKRATK